AGQDRTGHRVVEDRSQEVDPCRDQQCDGESCPHRHPAQPRCVHAVHISLAHGGHRAHPLGQRPCERCHQIGHRSGDPQDEQVDPHDTLPPGRSSVLLPSVLLALGTSSVAADCSPVSTASSSAAGSPSTPASSSAAGSSSMTSGTCGGSSSGAIEPSSVAVIAPSRTIFRLSPVASTMVEATPPGVGPASR